MHERALEEKRKAWLGLSLLPGWGPVRIWQAVGKGADPVPVWKQLQRYGPPDLISKAQADADRQGACIITWADAGFPVNLRQTRAAPVVLYLRGCLLRTDSVAVAIVGTRRASPQALQLAFILGRDLAGVGITVISGLAAGVDAAAHRGALSAGGRTIAVVAGGTDKVYPRAHGELASQIAEAGAIVSQFPCGMPPRPNHFPVRNRTLAGLALGTVVVEAPHRSGALITADFALDHGREVMVCPGDPLREHTQGSNALLREGASAVATAADVIEDLRLPLRWALDEVVATDEPGGHAEAGVEAASPRQAGLWEALASGPATVDEVAARTQADCVSVRIGLTELEMLGYVRREPGGQYSRVERQGARLRPQTAV